MKWYVFPLFYLIISGCKKDPAVANDKEAPIVVLDTPAEGQVYTPGTNIKIKGNITDNNMLAEIHIVLINNLAGTEYLHVHLYPQSPSINFNYDFPASPGVEYKIVITAIDRSVNQGYARVVFTCN